MADEQTINAEEKQDSKSRRNPLYESRDKLYSSSEKSIQLEGFTWLKQSADPEAAKIIAFGLATPTVLVKEEILTHFSNFDRDDMFDHLLEALIGCGEVAKGEVYKSFIDAGLAEVYLDKIEKYRQSVTKYPMLIKTITFLGLLGAQEMMDPIGQLVFVDNDKVRMAVIDALEELDNRGCLNFVLTGAKLFSLGVAKRSLKLITNLQDTNAILPLLYMLGEAEPDRLELIFDVLRSYDQDVLLKIVSNYLCQDDKALINSTLQYLEKTGNVDITRAIREKFQIGDEKKSTAGSGKTLSGRRSAFKETLDFEVKNIGDIILIGLKGVLDVYTLPRLKRVMEAICTHGHTKVILPCGRLDKIDADSSSFIAEVDTHMQRLLGGLRIVGLDCINEVDRKRLLPKAVFCGNLAKAASSFSVVRRSKYVMVDDDLVGREKLLEVTFKTDGQEKTRTTPVLTSDQFRLTLAWQVFDKTDIFQKFINDRIKLTFVKDNDVLEAQSKVVEQYKGPVPSIMVMRSRMACTVERRKAIRVNCHFNINFYQVMRSGNVAPTPLPGLCLNINSGGVLFVSPLQLAQGSFFILQFPQEEVAVGKILGQIVRRNERIEKGEMLFEYGINFARILDSDRMKIKKYVFDKISAGEASD